MSRGLIVSFFFIFTVTVMATDIPFRIDCNPQRKIDPDIIGSWVLTESVGRGSDSFTHQLTIRMDYLTEELALVRMIFNNDYDFVSYWIASHPFELDSMLQIEVLGSKEGFLNPDERLYRLVKYEKSGNEITVHNYVGEIVNRSDFVKKLRRNSFKNNEFTEKPEVFMRIKGGTRIEPVPNP